MATPLRAIRINDELWEALKEKAESEGKDASAVIRQLVTEYLKSR